MNGENVFLICYVSDLCERNNSPLMISAQIEIELRVADFEMFLFKGAAPISLRIL